MEKMKKDINIVKYSECTGCGLCSNICPQNAIAMVVDTEGFFHPQITNTKCIQCGLCEKKCPVLHHIEKKELYEEKVMACWSKDKAIRYYSTSGGVFSEFSHYILKNKGSVSGARYKKDFMVEHCVIHNENEISSIRQSKYIQSDIGYVYRKIKNELQDGPPVLFCGCPCQVSGLLAYLEEKRENLYLIDFICRGSNSPKALSSFLKMLESKYESRVESVWFKNKERGWNCFSTRIDFENGCTYSKSRYEDPFIQGYIHYNLYMRPSCYECKFKNRNKIVSDITLADFWGIGNKYPELDNDLGTSMVIINTKKGENLFEAVKSSLEYREVDMDTALRGNPCLKKSPKRNKRRSRFLKHLDHWGFEKCYYKYTRPTLKEYLKDIYYYIGHKVKYFVIEHIHRS